jgi:hypothetical protein
MKKDKEPKVADEQPENPACDATPCGINASRLLFSFEDLTITQEGNQVHIEKLYAGVGDSTISQIATGKQKIWQLLDEAGQPINIPETKGNRPFSWAGYLKPGLYCLTTGPTKEKATKHHRTGYQVRFLVP